jgi:hypothetical protein
LFIANAGSNRDLTRQHDVFFRGGSLFDRSRESVKQRDDWPARDQHDRHKKERFLDKMALRFRPEKVAAHFS